MRFAIRRVQHATATAPPLWCRSSGGAVCHVRPARPRRPCVLCRIHPPAQATSCARLTDGLLRVTLTLRSPSCANAYRRNACPTDSTPTRSARRGRRQAPTRCAARRSIWRRVPRASVAMIALFWQAATSRCLSMSSTRMSMRTTPSSNHLGPTLWPPPARASSPHQVQICVHAPAR